MKSVGGYSNLKSRTTQSGYNANRPHTKEGQILKQFDKLDERDKFVLRKTAVILG
jgi:hypothetical protein|tara:strand:- start:239 stop:403 length:165 start_codon:yes stop_codon:yes gene_type:complete